MVNTWADILNRSNLGMEVMHERNAHNFPLDLATGESLPVAVVGTRNHLTYLESSITAVIVYILRS